ncbi:MULTISPECIES: molybdopterin converting factor subunit 1 [Thiomicrorhabdus]|uniref:Molybdopterin synthase sulfur carrier subunit n=1 Tax=Thiomicrorhabdus heinhorstiae TaxID=2748010 RepID=A0ABS0BZ71_9GAMM|nr:MULTISPECIES: molybdopterin converting factor subunit 1 [Thiomicrorhabdus]MBF6059089.1 molybdopterin converting factor subunit 1 [Thiomicrorhabdus heinhorstiae]
MLNVLYFASFREILGKGNEQLPAQFNTVGCLLNALADRGESWQQALLENQNLQIAVNHDVANRQTEIKAGDEIAFFPPVTGG